MVINENNIKSLSCNIEDISTLSQVLNSVCICKLGMKSPNITCDELISYANISNDTRYYTFSVPKKKKGQFRQIAAPVDRLKTILRAVNHLLSLKYHPRVFVTGFVHNSSVVNNAYMHIRQPFVYNIDLKHFFDSISTSMVIARLQKAPYNYSYEVAEVIANMSSIIELETGSKHIAQGAPSSPIISNLICESLDDDLYALSNQYSVKYSRYADDITFSSACNIFSYKGKFFHSLKIIIEKHSFEINRDKIRVRGKQQRQEVTGLIVNEKVNVPRTFVKDIRNLLYIWEKYGTESAYRRFYVKYTKNFVPKHKYVPFFIDSLRGKLNYMALVKGANDSTYQRFEQKFNQLSKQTFNNFKHNSYRRIRRFERKVGKVEFLLDSPIIDKYGKTYYKATAPVSGGHIIFSPWLTELIALNPSNISDILYDKCSVHQIFDKDGVKWIAAERMGEDISEAVSVAIREDAKHKEEQPLILEKGSKDDSISHISYPYLVIGDSLLDTDDYGFVNSYSYYYCRSLEDAKKAFYKYFEINAHIKISPGSLSEQDFFNGLDYSPYDDYSWSCHIEKR